LHGYRLELRLFAFYLTVLTVVYIGCFISDFIYYETCNAYPGGAIEQTLLWPIAFPLRKAQQDELSKMAFFPKEAVDKITNDFRTMLLYFFIEFVVCTVLVYTAREAYLLGMLFERGPLGMGVHYGLGQFDEILNHEAIAKRKEPKSRFVEDAQLPLWQSDVEAEPLAYHVGHNYGAFHGKSARLSEGPSADAEQWNERSKEVEEEFADAERDLAKAKQAFDVARNVALHEKEEETNQEFEAIEKFRDQEINKEKYQEYRAEELAQYAAEEAARDAEADGLSPQEVRVAMMRAYQQKLSRYHRTMLEMTKARTLHQHYRHAEREQHYHEMEEEVAQRVQEAASEMDQAQRRMQNAQDAKSSLDAEKVYLMQQNMWQEEQSGGNEASEDVEALPGIFPDEPATLPRAAALGSPVELGFDSMAYAPASVAYPPPTLPMGSVGQTLVMGPVPTTPVSPNMMTSGNFGGTANFGSTNFMVPSNLSPSSSPSTLPPGTF